MFVRSFMNLTWPSWQRKSSGCLKMNAIAVNAQHESDSSNYTSKKPYKVKWPNVHHGNVPSEMH